MYYDQEVLYRKNIRPLKPHRTTTLILEPKLVRTARTSAALETGETSQHAVPTWLRAKQSDQHLHPAIGSESCHQRRALLAFTRDQRFALAVSLGNDDL